MTTLPHVSVGDPHTKAHNDERDAFNGLQTTVSNDELSVSYSQKLLDGLAATYRKRGPVNPEVSSITFGKTIANPPYNQSYALTGNARPALWPVDEGEGLVFISNNQIYSINPSVVTPRSVRVACDGDHFAWYGSTGNALYGSSVYVDGQPAAVNPIAQGTTTPTWNEIVFTSAKPRVIEIRGLGYIGAFYCYKPYQIWKPKPRKGPRVLIIGDSYAQGLGIETNQQNAMYYDIGPEIGTEDVWLDGESGTGYGVTSAANGTDIPPIGSNRYLDRVVPFPISGSPGTYWDVSTIKPDVVVVHGGGANDLFKGRTQAQIIADAKTVFTTLRAALPHAKLIFVEGFSPPGFTPGSYNPVYKAISSALIADSGMQGLGVYYVDVATTWPWILGSGYQGSTNGSGNSDIYICTDSFHPVDAGHLYIRTRIANAVKTIMADKGPLLNTLV